MDNTCNNNAQKKNTIQNSTILVTGGAGFIGSHLVDALATPQQQNKVIILDNLSTGKIANISHHFTENIDSATAKANKNKEEQKQVKSVSNKDNTVTFINGDIRDCVLLQNIFQKYKPTYIFHLAAIASVPKSITSPRETHDVNVTGTVNLLDEARKINNVKKFVFSSSCAVYGNPNYMDIPLKETAPTKPMSPYATSKLASEQYCRVFSETYELPTVCLRYFNVYGKRQDPNGDYAAVIPKFINRAQNHEPLIIYGDGGQTRDFIHVNDVINANMVTALNKEVQTTINIGTGLPTDIEFLARVILSLTDNELDHIQYEAHRTGDIKDSFADNTKLEQILNDAEREYPMDLKTGLIELLDIDEEKVLIV